MLRFGIALSDSQPRIACAKNTGQIFEVPCSGNNYILSTEFHASHRGTLSYYLQYGTGHRIPDDLLTKGLATRLTD